MLSCGSVFSGIGLLDYGLTLAGIHHTWLCERDEWRRSILAQRWPGARVLDDVRHVGHGCEPVELVAGGFPCKGASTAGKRNGFDHAETVLWREMARAVRELRPRYVLVENVANILSIHRGAVWAEVLGTLATLGYDVVWDCLPAGAVGAPHGRDRVFAVAAYAAGELERAADHEADAEPGERDARQVPRVGGAEPAPDAAPERRAAPTGAGEQSRLASHARAGDPAAVADSERGGQGPGERHLRPRQSDAQGRAEVAPDARERRQPEQPPEHGGQPARPDADPLGRGVSVEWGVYGPAIRRWEAIHGPAPEPLVRGVDDRGAARVERSRLSALGDGVQVQIGRIAGEYIVGLERERMRAAA